MPPLRTSHDPDGKRKQSASRTTHQHEKKKDQPEENLKPAGDHDQTMENRWGGGPWRIPTPARLMHQAGKSQSRQTPNQG